MSFGSNLLELRKKKGLSQEEMAEAVGVTRQTIYTWEYDQVSPSIENLKALSVYFSVTVDELVGELKNNTINPLLEEERCHADKNLVTKKIKQWAFCVSLATTFILIGVAVFLLFGNNTEDMKVMPGLAILFAMIIIALPFYIVGGMTHDQFFKQEEVKNYKSLYTKEEERNFMKKYPITIAVGTTLVLLDVVFLIAIYVNPSFEDATWPMALFIAFLTIPVYIFIYYGMIEEMCFSKKKSREDTIKSEKKEKIATAVHSLVWLLSVAGYLLMGLVWDLWNPGWIIFIVAAAISGFMEIVYGEGQKE